MTVILTRIEDRTRGATDYTYDPVGRLLKSVTPDLTEIFAFDPAGNPVDPEKMTPPPVVETPQEKAERFARESAEDAAWLRAHPDEQYPPLRHNKPICRKRCQRYYDQHAGAASILVRYR